MREIDMSITKEDLQYEALETIQAVIHNTFMTPQDRLKLIQQLVIAALENK